MASEPKATLLLNDWFENGKGISNAIEPLATVSIEKIKQQKKKSHVIQTFSLILFFS